MSFIIFILIQIKQSILFLQKSEKSSNPIKCTPTPKISSPKLFFNKKTP